MPVADKNKYNREKYYRPKLTLPIQEEPKIKGYAASIGMTVNQYLVALYKNDVSEGSSKFGRQLIKFTAEQETLLKKWQIPAKYYGMIESLSFTKEEGYYIRLKDGYTNDAVNGRDIFCSKTSEVRRIISQTHSIGTPLVNNRNGRTASLNGGKTMSVFYLSDGLRRAAEEAAEQDSMSFAEYVELLILKDVSHRNKTE